MTTKGKVLMLTGAAGTGKSTLSKELQKRLHPLKRVDFGQLLLERKIRHGHPGLTYEDLRRDSARLVTSEDVRAVDQELIESLPSMRREGHILIDSHAVTQEQFGYRITHYSFEQLKSLALDAVIVTYCHPAELVARRQRDPGGRPRLNEFEAQHQMALQEAVAVNYAITCGCRCYVLNSAQPVESLAAEISTIVGNLTAR